MVEQSRKHGSLVRFAGRALAAVLDPSIVLSFDRTGYRVHSLDFRTDDLDVDMRGKVCLVTGANSGLGRATATALARRGAEVWLLCRSVSRARPVVDAIRRETGNAEVRLEVVDVGILDSVRAFAARFTRPVVDVLVHNAAVLPDLRSETPDGIELTLATNVVGPFLLTQLLLPRLAAASQGRVINVSSGGMYARRLTLDDPQFERPPFDGVTAYAWTKRAAVVLSELWAERLRGTRVTVNAMHPGWADTPSVRTSLPRFYRVMQPLLRGADEGADTIVWLAVCPRLACESGRFWFDRSPRATHYLPWTKERPADRVRLWELCCQLAGIDLEDAGRVLPTPSANGSATVSAALSRNGTAE